MRSPIFRIRITPDRRFLRGGARVVFNLEAALPEAGR